MGIRTLERADQDVIRRCIEALLAGDLIHPGELHARIGVGPAGLRKVLTTWPPEDDDRSDSDAHLIVNNCLNEIANGVDISSGERDARVGVDRDDLAGLLLRWRLSLNRSGI